MKENDIKELFGHYIQAESDITVTKEVRKGKERSLFATIQIKEEDKTDILEYNGMNVNDKQIVVEETKRNMNQHGNARHEKDDKDKETPQCRFYLQGRCNKPNDCAFEHRPACKFYERNGRCRFGETCKFAHINKGTSRQGGGNNNDILSVLIKALAPQLSRNSR